MFDLIDPARFATVHDFLLARGGVGNSLLHASATMAPMRGINSINLIVYGDRTGGTCKFYRMGRDSSFGVLV